MEPKINHLQPGERNMPSPFSMAYMDIRNGRDVTFSFLGRPTEREKFPPDVKAGLHRHTHYELVFVLEGEYIQRMENGNFRYRAGDVIFLNRSVRHGEGYDSDCVLVFLNLSPDFLESLFQSPASQLLPGAPQNQQGPIWQFLRTNSENSDTRFCREYLDFFSLGGRERTAALLDSIAQELTLSSTGYGFRVQALLLEFFAVLEDPSLYLLSHIRIDASSQEFLCARILRYLEAHHGRATRQELGRYFHYNGDYLNRLVKKFLRQDHLPAGAAHRLAGGSAPAAGNGSGHLGDHSGTGICQPDLFLPHLPTGNRHDPRRVPGEHKKPFQLQRTPLSLLYCPQQGKQCPKPSHREGIVSNPEVLLWTPPQKETLTPGK